MTQATEPNTASGFGLTAATIDRINGVLAAFPAIEQAILYGSRAKGNFRPGSDIDLAIVGPEVTEQQMLQLANKLDDLPLPYTFDLARLEAIRDAALIEHIKRVGIIFYQSAKRTALKGAPQ